MTFEIPSYRPKLSERLGKLIDPINRLFDWLYHSRYNPLYRSGTLAIALLLILLVTGLYLIFFYSVSQPYESVAAIQSQIWVGRWVRAVHRYATDVAILAVVFHILQILVQGKIWGPRLLAWLSGVVLLGCLFLSTWTGYVMVWDKHGQLLALAGAEMLQVFPFLHDILAMAFNGSTQVDQGFFFMNLFLHVGAPLLMVFGIWIHTAKLARADWFPARKVCFALAACLVVLGLVWPAPLPEKAHLLRAIGEIPVDWFSGFWLPLVNDINPVAGLALMIGGPIFLASMPWWWSLRELPASSRVNPETCSGCTQCVLDCPYEAISMHPHTSGKRLLASVDPALCVSCAICAASCDDHAIGPPNRTAIEQIARTKAFLQEGLTDKDGQKVVVLACGKNGRMLEDLRRLIAGDETICLYPVDCCGTIHSEVLETLLSKCAGAMLLGCPVGNCINRDGLRLVRERIFEKRVPFLHRSIERSRLSLCAFSDKEAHLALSAVQHLRSNLVKTPREREAFKEPWLPFFLRRTVATAVVLGGIAAISQFLYGSAPNSSIFRVAVQIPGRAKQECRPLTAEEKAKLPMHMQRPEICDSVSLDYRLSVMVDRLEKSNKVFTHRGVHGDSPILIHDDIHVSGGRHDFEIALAPLQAAPQNSDSFTYKGSLDMEVGRIYLLRYEHTSNSLELAP